MNTDYNTWTDENLQAELEKISAVLTVRKRKAKAEKAKKLCINGITAKDIAVEYGSYDGSEITDINEVNFSFFVKHDGVKYNIYYEAGTYDDKHNFTIYPWWPIVGEEGDDQYERNGAFEFIPPGFAEACENSYEFRGTFDEAVARLKEYGITDVTKGDW